MKKFKKNKLFNGGPRNLMGMALIAFLALGVLMWLTEYSRTIQVMTYSAFLDVVEQNKVKEVYVDGQEVRGKLIDGVRFECTTPDAPQLWDLLRKHNVDMAVANQAGYFSHWYISLLLIVLALIWMAWTFFKHHRGASGGNGGNSGIFTMGKSRARMFSPATIKERFDSVAGIPEAKEELQDIVDFLRDPKKYERLGAKITRGALLVGEPGNGKTLLARAVAGEANCPFFSVSGSDFIEVFVGVGAARVRDLFVQARKNAPSIIFIDEIDAVGRHRGSGLGGGNDEREQTLNQLLTEMDGFEPKESVIVLAATNRPDVLDKALLRPGRFDRRVEIPFPDLKSREEILRVHAKPIKMDATIDLHKIARGTPGFSGADLANLLNEAAIIASKRGSDFVTIHHIEEARDKIILGKERKSTVLSDEERNVISYHESGHALVRLLMPDDSDPLHKLTILPRGGALGVTHFLPEREKYIKSRQEIVNSIMSSLGGRAAEELVFGRLTTGAASDLDHVTNLARAMVCNYGMEPESVGLVLYSQNHGSYEYSQKMAEKIDETVQRLVTGFYAQTKELLASHRDKLDLLAITLLEKETMYAHEVYELLGIEPRADLRLTD